MANSNVHFEKLDRLEKQSKLFQLTQRKNFVTVWLKGNSLREKYEVTDFAREKLELFIKSTPESTMLDKEVLYSFDLSGVNFFGKGKTKLIEGETWSIDCASDLFKSERRTTYRLLTYPNYNVFAFFKINEEYVGQNVIDFRTKQSQTGIFKDFLRIVGDDKDSLDKEGHLHFRVKDLSVTGLALEIGELEKKFFTAGEKTGKIYLNFEGQEFSIPDAKIVYVIDVIGKENKGRMFKVGVQFLKVDLGLDQKLGNLINKALRDVEDEFEDFIK